MFLKKINKVIAIGLSMFMSIPTVPIYVEAMSSAERIVNNENCMPKKDYVVMAKTEEQVNNLEAKYDSSEVISDSSQNYLQENHMAVLTLSECEKEQLICKGQVEYIEEDVEVVASSMGNVPKYHPKRVIETKQKRTDEEWNMRMIHADTARKKIKKKYKKDLVKIAVLDTGVDYNTDMNIAETLSIIPGEEEVNPLFMDATGHGTSVAGLIAAKDNDDGITGVDPYAEIYSIRVLDDKNRSPVSRVIEGIYMAIARKVDIINMSFGVNLYSQALERAVNDALDAGILIVAAAGNTGSAEKAGVDSTIQYPAAFNGVIAVGSVDKRGEISESSSTGNEVDLVAPGELVRSTGMFDSEVVASGTSLAAPQVSGAAALILEQDKNVSSEFVRQLLCESANAYGEEDIYGSGLLDVGYAIENYNLLKKQYNKRSIKEQVKSNTSRITVFENTGCVEGCWSRNNHESLIGKSYTNVKKGARFPDGEPVYYRDGVNDKKVALYYFSGIDYNPWWHGYFRKVVKGNYLCNYVATYIYETKIANELVSNAKVNGQNGISDTIQREIRNDVGRIDWQREYGYIPSKGVKRAFVWGMAIHNLADAFAHSTCRKGGGDRIKHPDADSIKVCSQRWTHAAIAVDSAMRRYTKKDQPAGSYDDFSIVQKATGYKMINIKENISAVKDVAEGKKYNNSSEYKNEKDQ